MCSPPHPTPLPSFPLPQPLHLLAAPPLPVPPSQAAKLKYMLEMAIQRRFPRGLKVHIQTFGAGHDLAELTRVWKDVGLWITRAKVRATEPGEWGR